MQRLMTHVHTWVKSKRINLIICQPDKTRQEVLEQINGGLSFDISLILNPPVLINTKGPREWKQQALSQIDLLLDK
jgi:hypothetical protein